MADSNPPHFNPNIGQPRLSNGPQGQGFQPPSQQYPGPPPMPSKGMQPQGGFPNQVQPNMHPYMGNPQNPLPPSLPPMGVPQQRPGGPAVMNSMMPPNSNMNNGPGSNVNGFRTPPPSNVQLRQGPPSAIQQRPPGPQFPRGPPTNPLTSGQNVPTFSQSGGQFMNGSASNMQPPAMKNVGPPPTGTPASSLPGGFSGPNPNAYSSAPPMGGVPQIRGPLSSGPTNFGPPPSITETPPSSSYQGPPKSTANMQGIPGQNTDRPDELPVPFHGQGQYSHQVGMRLTAGLTPNNSEPPSQKSSRGPSPIGNPSYDALEGQFTQNYSQQNSTTEQPTSTVTSPSNPRPFHPSISAAPPMMLGPQQQTGIPPPQFSGAPSGQRPPYSQMTSGPPMAGGPSPMGPPVSMTGAPPTSQDMSRGQQFGQMNTQGPPSGPMSGQYGSGMGGGPPAGPPSGPLSGPPPGGFVQSGFQQQRPGGHAMAQQYPGMPPPPQMGTNNQTYPPNNMGGQPVTSSMSNNPMAPGVNALSSTLDSLSLQARTINLLQEKRLIPSDGVETPKPRLPHDHKQVVCNPDVFRCTLTSIPQTSSLLNKCRLPLGILIHPFRDLSQLPVIQSSVIVRCRSCRTYINPFVFFVDQRRWKCNLCYRVNELPEEFQFDPVSKTYGEPQRRPEIKSATIEFIAPSEYMLRPPQPAVYLYLLDVSFNAIETGYLKIFCQTLLDELDKVPKDSRTQIGFIAYDRALHFFNLAAGLSQPQMLIVPDLEDVFLPCPDDLLVNLQESKELVIDLLSQLPDMFEGNLETGSALGSALQSAFKLISTSGGRVTVMQTVLPTVGPGALQSREDTNQRTTKNVNNLGPATDFYKKLALDCSAQQVAVDLFMLNGQYADLASVSCISKYSGGSVQYYPSFHAVKNRSLADKYEEDLRRYFTRKIGFEAVMRIRCTKGLSIHTFHGNFFVRSTDLLSLPNINPDAGFGMQMSIEDNLTETSTACFQAALLYTSSKGERRIRVHTMCLPVTNQVNEIISGADQRAIVCLLAKMAADRSITSSMSDAREALINAAIDALSSFGATLPSAQRMSGLPISFNLRLLPTFVLAMLKSAAFRHGVNTRLDDRVNAMQQCKSLPLEYLMKMFYPDLYPVHNLDESNSVTKNDVVVCQAPLLHLSSANIDRYGVYLMDTFEAMYLYVGSAVSEEFCEEILDVPNFMSIPEGMVDLPELDTPQSERLRNFISNLMDNRPGGPTFLVIREDSKNRMMFFQHMVEDRTEASMSYYEFLQHLQKQIKS